MLRVTVELLPGGNEARKRTLGRLDIANDATGDSTWGNYNGVLHAEYTPAAGRWGRVHRYNRKNQSVWTLVGAFLKLFGHTKHSPSLMKMLPLPETPADIPVADAATVDTANATHQRAARED